MHVGLEGGKGQTYILKQRDNESPSHFFLIKNVEEFIKSFTHKVWIFQSRKPDIIFEDYAGQKYAIEVETGTWLEKNPKGFAEKIKQLNNEYGNNWFILVTDALKKRDYEKFGRTCARAGAREEILRIFHQEGKEMGAGAEKCL